MGSMLKAIKRPCPSCPYRKDVPSGIWEGTEYAKLPDYDGDMPEQIEKGAIGVFMCHQQNGCLCGGWLLTHGPENLLALRLYRMPGSEPLDPAIFDYDGDGVKCFASGAEAAAHGIRDIENPGTKARKKIDGLVRKQNRRIRAVQNTETT
jgi:hypothetical protein